MDLGFTEETSSSSSTADWDSFCASQQGFSQPYIIPSSVHPLLEYMKQQKSCKPCSLVATGSCTGSHLLALAASAHAVVGYQEGADRGLGVKWGDYNPPFPGHVCFMGVYLRVGHVCIKAAVAAGCTPGSVDNDVHAMQGTSFITLAGLHPGRHCYCDTDGAHR